MDILKGEDNKKFAMGQTQMCRFPTVPRLLLLDPFVVQPPVLTREEHLQVPCRQVLRVKARVGVRIEGEGEGVRVEGVRVEG
jgi:hypothetical protein